MGLCRRRRAQPLGQGQEKGPEDNWHRFLVTSGEGPPPDSGICKRDSYRRGRLSVCCLCSVEANLVITTCI